MLAELGVLVLSSVNKVQCSGNIMEVFTEHSFIKAATEETLAVNGNGQGAEKDDKGGVQGDHGSNEVFSDEEFPHPNRRDP